MKTKAILSLISGFLFGFFGHIVLLLLDIDHTFQLSVVCGLLFALLLFPFLIVYEKIMDKRYAEFENELTSPIFYKTSGNFNLGNGRIKNGNIYFCETGIVCISLERKPYTLDEILLQDIDHFAFTLTQLNILTNDERWFVIIVSNANEIRDLLMKKGWISPE